MHKNKISKQQLNLMWHQKLQQPWTQKKLQFTVPNSLDMIFHWGIWVHLFYYERDLPRCNSTLVVLSLMKDTWCKHWNIANRPEFRSLGTHGQRSKTSSNPHTEPHSYLCKHLQVKDERNKPNGLSSISRICGSLGASKCRRPMHMFQQCC
jgi:hypothetical protein